MSLNLARKEFYALWEEYTAFPGMAELYCVSQGMPANGKGRVAVICAQGAMAALQAWWEEDPAEFLRHCTEDLGMTCPRCNGTGELEDEDIRPGHDGEPVDHSRTWPCDLCRGKR